MISATLYYVNKEEVINHQLIPFKELNHVNIKPKQFKQWIPAYAGMTILNIYQAPVHSLDTRIREYNDSFLSHCRNPVQQSAYLGIVP